MTQVIVSVTPFVETHHLTKSVMFKYEDIYLKLLN